MKFALFVLALTALAQDTQAPSISDAQRSEFWKLQAHLNGAASQVNGLQLQLNQARAQFDQAKAIYDADVKMLEKLCGGELDTADEPKCKPLPPPDTKPKETPNAK